MRTVIVFCCTIYCSLTYVNTIAQYRYTSTAIVSNRDTIPAITKWNIPTWKQPFPASQMIVPALLIGYGITAMENDGLEKLDNSIKEEVWTDKPHRPIAIDNYLQYAPGLAVYGLNAFGIKGKNNFRDRTILYLLSNGIMAAIVNPLKMATKLQRPDGAGTNAFPSGHTATAFVGAEFLHQEYKDVSPWYGIAGYTVAATVGGMRIYNNKHWMRDVVAGAGIGMASTKLAYWLYPKIKRAFLRNKPSNTVVMPSYENNSFGLSLVHQFERKHV